MSDQSRSDDEPAVLASGQRALVVFEDRTDSQCLRLLRPGFRHCFCIVGIESTWTLCDPLKTRIELMPISGLSEHDLADYLAWPNRTVLRGEVCGERSPRPIRLRAVSCVEVVKRVLNIDAASALTPYQLCRTLLHSARPSKAFVPHSSADKTLDSISY